MRVLRIVGLIVSFWLLNCHLVWGQSPKSDHELPPLIPHKSPGRAFPDKITIKRLDIEGSQFTSEINSILSPYLNQEVSLDEIAEITHPINQFYQNQGYVVSFAFIPLQKFVDGIIKIRVVEGYLAGLEVDGNSAVSDRYIKAQLLKSLKSVPLKLSTLETELRLLQQNPQIARVKAQLRPGLNLGENLLFLNIEESPTTTLSISADNDFSPAHGELGVTLAAEKRSLLVQRDLLHFQSTLTEGLEKYQISYAIPLNAAEGMLSASYQNNRSNIVEEPFDTADIKGKIEQIALLYRQPLSRSLTEELTTTIGLDSSSVKSFLFGDFPFSFAEGANDGFYRVSTLRWGLLWQTRSTKEVLILSSQVNLGLDLFGATINDGLPDSNFLIWQGQGRWLKALDRSRKTQLIVNIKVQLTPDELLPSEQFVMGGIDTVRGYRQNLLLADSGINLSLETRIPIFDSESWGLLQITPFFDFGTVWNNQNQLDSSTLASVGLGVRWTLENFLEAHLDYGIPLIPVKQQGNSLSEDGWHFKLQLIPIRF